MGVYGSREDCRGWPSKAALRAKQSMFGYPDVLRMLSKVEHFGLSRCDCYQDMLRILSKVGHVVLLRCAEDTIPKYGGDVLYI